MTFRGIMLASWKRLRSAFDEIYPLVHAMRTNRELRREAEECAASDKTEELRKAGLALDALSISELTTVFAEDIARLRRLEDKVSGQMTTVSLLLGVASVIGGAAVAQCNVFALLLVGLTFVWLVSAGLLALQGSRAMRLHLPDPLAAISDSSNKLPQRLAADRLQALSLNAPVGWQLNNALFAAQRSLVVSVTLLIASVLVTAAQQFAA